MTVALCSNKQQWWFNIGLINAEHCALRLITSSGRKQNADRVHNSGSCMSLKSLCLKSKSRTGKCWKSHKFVCFIPGNALLKAIMFNSWAIEANWIWQSPQEGVKCHEANTHTAFVFCWFWLTARSRAVWKALWTPLCPTESHINDYEDLALRWERG